jgi:RNA-binding protein 5/10
MQAAQWSMNNGYSTNNLSVINSSALPSKLLPPGLPPHPVLSGSGILPPPPSLWPPIFELSGSSYVFQPKTGYFFEPLTDFYYCPKSKLYYNGKDGTYFTYDTTLDPPFRRYEVPIPIGEPEEVKPVEKESGGADPATEITGNNKISVNLGSKIKVKPVAIAAPKKVLNQFAKWGAVAKEEDDEEKEDGALAKERLRKSVGKAAAVSEDAVSVNAKGIVNPSNASSDEILISSSSPATIKDQKKENSESNHGESSPKLPVAASSSSSSSSSSTVPAAPSQQQNVCRLCRRQFQSAEMLTRHEKESKLHAENLAKQKEQEEKEKEKESSPSVEYRDRAAERREKFGSVPDHIPEYANDSSPPSSSSAYLAASLVLPPPAALNKPPVAVSQDDHNPGNQMLRKMGWKEGQGLGRDNEGKETAVGVELASSANLTSQSSMYSTLNSTRPQSSSGPIPGNYKDHVYHANRARFEQMMQNAKK